MHVFKVLTAFTEKFVILSKSHYEFVTGSGAHTILDGFSDDMWRADNLYNTFQHRQFAFAFAFLNIAKTFDVCSRKVK